jgi:microcystin-dependent protein
MAANIVNPTRFRRPNSTVFNYIMEDSQHIKDLTLDELYVNNMNIHLGTGTGYFVTHQQTGAIAIGAYAGSNEQGTYSISIGAYAGQNNQHNNSIVLNGSGNTLNTSTGGFYVNPINRNENYVDFQNLTYNPTTKEIVYSFPIAGVINIYAGSSAPLGTLLCDGSAVSRTTYGRLYDAIGTTYGIGDGVNTFNLPNLTGRVPVGLKSTETIFNTLGNIGGTGAHTLSIAEMPAHTHSYVNQPNSVSVQTPVTGTDVADNVNVSQTSGSTGGSLAHNNLQPYIVLNYIISF